MSVDRHQQGLLISPRFELDDRIYAVHGSFNYAELEQRGLDAHNVLDFSVNSNPYGPSPAVVAALSTVDPACYPDRECLALRRALAEHLGVTPEEIVVGNGASELIWLIAFVFLRPGDRALIVGPTFGEYARVARLVGAQTFHWDAIFSEQFILNSDAIAATITATRPHVVFLCNPNNPTGMWVENHVIAAWAGAAPQTLFVVDEAYIEFVDGMSSAHTLRLPNLISVRSMTKEYAIAGLRLGYYVLVQCGAPVPTDYPDATIIEAPVQRVAVLTSTELPHLNALEKVDHLVALEEFDYVNTPAVRERINAGELAEVGGGATVNVEMLIDLAPDLVVTFAYGNPETDAHPKLIEAGLPVVLNAGYMETTPLGRSEVALGILAGPQLQRNEGLRLLQAQCRFAFAHEAPHRGFATLEFVWRGAEPVVDAVRRMLLLGRPRVVFQQPLVDDFPERIHDRTLPGLAQVVDRRRWVNQRPFDGLARAAILASRLPNAQAFNEGLAPKNFLFVHRDHPSLRPYHTGEVVRRPCFQ